MRLRQNVKPQNPVSTVLIRASRRSPAAMVRSWDNATSGRFCRLHPPRKLGSPVKPISHPHLLIATVALLAAGLVGCSSDDDSSTSGSIPVETSPVESTATDEATTQTTESTETDESSEEEVQAVCEARDDLNDSVGSVVDDLKSGNLDGARAKLDDVRTDRDALSSAIDDLGTEERDRLRPELDQLSTDIDAMSDASGLSGWQSALSDLRSSLGDLVDQVDTDLGCSD